MPKKFKLKRAKYLTPPRLDNNPVWDTVVTSLTPMLSFTNGAKGIGDRTYSVQVSKVPTFNYKTLIEFEEIKEAPGETTSLLVDVELEDKTLYYWRVSVADQEGNHTEWEVSRFFVDTEYIFNYANLCRLPFISAKTSSSISIEKATDLMQLDSFWHSDYGDNSEQYLEFDFGKEIQISKFWAISDPNAEENVGWPIDYHLEKSNDAKKWIIIEETEISKSKSGRIEFDFEDLTTHHIRLVISKWVGISVKINNIRFYTPAKQKQIIAPKSDYILLIGTEQDGSTHTDLAGFIKKHYPKLEVLNLPFYDASFDAIESLKNMPIALIFSSNTTDYCKVPFHEYSGVFDIIRNCDIPTLGIGAGMHLQYMSYCSSYVRKIGFGTLNIIEIAEERKRAKSFIRQKESPLLQDVINKFTCVETNQWEVVEKLSEVIEYEDLADLDYPMVVKSKLKEMYGVQFMPNIKATFNQAENVLHNFIKLAIDEQLD